MIACHHESQTALGRSRSTTDIDSPVAPRPPRESEEDDFILEFTGVGAMTTFDVILMCCVRSRNCGFLRIKTARSLQHSEGRSGAGNGRFERFGGKLNHGGACICPSAGRCQGCTLTPLIPPIPNFPPIPHLLPHIGHWNRRVRGPASCSRPSLPANPPPPSAP